MRIAKTIIDREELIEGENLTHFIHALSNLAPSLVYTNITGDKKSSLSFNYLANQLFFQYSEKGE